MLATRHLPCKPKRIPVICWDWKHFLFKVEVSEGNIVNGWQTFTVKKITHDAAIIQQFFRKHDMQVVVLKHPLTTNILMRTMRVILMLLISYFFIRQPTKKRRLCLNTI